MVTSRLFVDTAIFNLFAACIIPIFAGAYGLSLTKPNKLDLPNYYHIWLLFVNYVENTPMLAKK